MVHYSRHLKESAMLQKKEKYVVAVVGATGAVGTEMIATLQQRQFLWAN